MYQQPEQEMRVVRDIVAEMKALKEENAKFKRVLAKQHKRVKTLKEEIAKLKQENEELNQIDEVSRAQADEQVNAKTLRQVLHHEDWVRGAHHDCIEGLTYDEVCERLLAYQGFRDAQPRTRDQSYYDLLVERSKLKSEVEHLREFKEDAIDNTLSYPVVEQLVKVIDQQERHRVRQHLRHLEKHNRYVRMIYEETQKEIATAKRIEERLEEAERSGEYYEQTCGYLEEIIKSLTLTILSSGLMDDGEVEIPDHYDLEEVWFLYADVLEDMNEEDWNQDGRVSQLSFTEQTLSVE